MLDNLKKTESTLSNYSFAIFIATGLVGIFLNNANKGLDAFYGRAIGPAVLDGVDPNWRHLIFTSSFVIFFLSLLVGIVLLNRFDRFIKLRLDLAEIKTEKRTITIVSAFGIVGIIQFFLNQSNPYIVGFFLYIDIIIYLNILSIFFYSGGSDTNNKRLLDHKMQAFVFLFPLCLIFGYWALFDREFIFHERHILIYVGLNAFIIIIYHFFSNILVKRFSYDIGILDRIILVAFVPILFIPISIPLSNEMQYSLASIMEIDARTLSKYNIIFLILVASTLLLISIFRRKSYFYFRSIVTHLYFPVVIATSIIYLTYHHNININSLDLLHLGNYIVPTQQFFQFGNIPYIDVWYARGLMDFLYGFLYTIINGYHGLDILLWMPLNDVIFSLLCYFLFTSLFTPLIGLLAVLFLPVMAAIGSYYGFTIFPGLVLLWTIKKFSVFRLVCLWMSALLTFAWFQAVGMFAIPSILLCLLMFTWHEKKANWKKILLSFSVVFGIGLFCYCTTVIIHGKSILENIRLILDLRYAERIGAYPNLWTGEQSRSLIVLQYGLFPALVIIYLYLAWYFIYKKREIKPQQIILTYIALVAMFAFYRNLGRHCLIEGLQGHFALFLFIALPIWFLDRYRGFIAFCSLAIVLCFFFPFQWMLKTSATYFSYKTFEKDEIRIDVDVNSKKIYSDLKAFFDHYLQPDQTFFDFVNAPLLYALTEREFPFFQHATQIIQVESAQRTYLQQWNRFYDQKKIPFVIFSSKTWWGNAIDNIPSPLGAYLIGEFIYMHYHPFADVHGFQIWLANNMPDIVLNSAKTNEQKDIPLKLDATVFDCRKLGANNHKEIIVKCGHQDPQINDFLDLAKLELLDDSKIYNLQIEYRTNVDGQIQVFFGDEQGNFSEQRSSLQHAEASNSFKNFEIELGSHIKGIKKLRIDPPNGSTFEISKAVLIESSGVTLIQEEDLKQDYLLWRLAYIWGNYDSKKPTINTQVLGTILDHTVSLNDKHKIDFDIPTDIDKATGNYIHFRVRSSKKSNITMSYGKAPVSSFSFEVLPAKDYKDYLIRISSQWKWMNEIGSKMYIESTPNSSIDIESIVVRKGD